MKINIPTQKNAEVDFGDSVTLMWAEYDKINRGCCKTVACFALIWFVAAVSGGLLFLTFLADQVVFVHKKFSWALRA